MPEAVIFSYQSKMQDRAQDKVQDKMQSKMQDRLQEKMQDKFQDKMQNKMQIKMENKIQNIMHTVYFTQAKAVLPVKLKNGEVKLVTWGRRENENSEMPLGGWARLASIKNDKDNRWNLYLPKPVQIPITKFMEKNFEGRACWYEVTKGKCIQGLLAHCENEYRVYIVPCFQSRLNC